MFTWNFRTPLTKILNTPLSCGSNSRIGTSTSPKYSRFGVTIIFHVSVALLFEHHASTLECVSPPAIALIDPHHHMVGMCIKISRSRASMSVKGSRKIMALLNILLAKQRKREPLHINGSKWGKRNPKNKMHALNT